jgi:hypothetical protein
MALPNDEGKRTGMDTRVRCPLCAVRCLPDYSFQRLLSGKLKPKLDESTPKDEP